ncbi:MAG TPA: hypothetical protein VEI47_05220, partial [Gemmatimonadales bacterium]|nr:hypothetical protein [Gemmatimonadales bacterium]
MRRSGGWLVAFLLASCTHSEPFGSGNIPANGPPGTGSPLRLTLNPGQNRDPAWLRDQSGIQYSFQQAADPDLDYCLGVLPPAGGTRLAEKCYPGDPSGQSTDALTNPAPGPGGRLAWVEAHSPVGSLSPITRTIRTGS